LKAVFLIKSFATDYNPQLSAACMIADGWFKVLSLNSHNYVNEQLICKDNKYLLLFPLDTELLLLAENEFY
jgi:carbamoyl-phosphate synthase large subunit